MLELAKERPDASVEFEAAGQMQRGARLRTGPSASGPAPAPADPAGRTSG
ncbi:hypothetical protein F750_7044 [Streptomyces sp. PAMC 26508]|nr:hypothetical protein F750_7044 [Streptomyces sp. PAMC 26508]